MVQHNEPLPRQLIVSTKETLLCCAVQQFDLATLMQPENILVLQLRGLARARLGEYKGALQDLEPRADTEVLLLACAMCHANLGTSFTWTASSVTQPGVLIATQDPRRASIMALAQQVAEYFSENLNAALPTLRAGISDTTQRRTQASPKNSTVQRALGQAINRFREGDFVGVVRDLDLAELLKPGDALVLQLRGLAKAHLEDYKGALQDLEHRADTEVLLAACAKCHANLGTHNRCMVSSTTPPEDGQCAVQLHQSFKMVKEALVANDIHAITPSLQRAVNVFNLLMIVSPKGYSKGTWNRKKEEFFDVLARCGDWHSKLSREDDPQAVGVLREYKLGSHIPLDAATSADDCIIHANGEAFQGNLEGALAGLDLADRIRPMDCATLQARGIVHAQMEQDHLAKQDVDGRADVVKNLLIRYICHMRLGHIGQALADMLRLDIMQPTLAENCFKLLESFPGSAEAKQTAQQPKRRDYVKYVQALTSGFTTRRQSSSKEVLNELQDKIDDTLAASLAAEGSDQAIAGQRLFKHGNHSAALQPLRRASALCRIITYRCIVVNNTKHADDVSDFGISLEEKLELCKDFLTLNDAPQCVPKKP